VANANTAARLAPGYSGLWDQLGSGIWDVGCTAQQLVERERERERERGGHHFMYNESLELTAPQHTAVKT
jgi:hypothetical protein